MKMFHLPLRGGLHICLSFACVASYSLYVSVSEVCRMFLGKLPHDLRAYTMRVIKAAGS